MYVRTFVWMDKARRALKLFNLTVSQCMYCLVRLLRALIASTRSIQHSSNRYRSNYILLGLELARTHQAVDRESSSLRHDCHHYIRGGLPLITQV